MDDSVTMLIQHLTTRDEAARKEAWDREDRLRREAQEREDQAKKEAWERERAAQNEAWERDQKAKREAGDREERMLTLMSNMKLEAAAAAQKQTEMYQEKLAYDQKCYEKTLEQTKKDKADREKQERIKLIPKPQPMTAKEDVDEYLELFEINMADRDIPKNIWAHHLIPLLNSNCKAAVASLPLGAKYHYKTVTDLLTNTCTQTCRYPGQQLLEGGIKQGETFRATVVRLGRLATKYAPEDDAAKVRDKMVLEVFLRSLPKSASNYVREKEPTSACQAADLASKFMSREGRDELKYSTPRDGQDRDRDYGREPDSYHGQRHRRFNTAGGDRSGAHRQSQEAAQGDNEGHKGSPAADNKGDNKPSYKGKPSTNAKSVHWKEVCWECGGNHKRDACPKLIPKTKATTAKVTCMSIQISDPVTVQGKVGERPVKRMLIDTGADISLIAMDMLPRSAKLGKPVWVEGVGKQSQLYKTAQVPVTIQGVTETVLMAVAPTQHIPFSVVLGRNVPGLNFTWTFGTQQKVVAAKKGSKDTTTVDKTSTNRDNQVAGERASQVVQESAGTLAPTEAVTKVQEPKPPQQAQNVPKEVRKTDSNGRHTEAKSGCKEIHSEGQSNEEKLAEKFPSPASPNLEEGINTLSKPISRSPNMEISIDPVQQNLDNLATAVALAVETRAAKAKRLQEEQANQEATAASGVQLTPLGAVRPPMEQAEEPHIVDSADVVATSNLEGEADPQEDFQFPFDCPSQPTETSPAPAATPPASKNPKQHGKYSRRGKKATHTAAERPAPAMQVSRKMLLELQHKDGKLGPILRGETPAHPPYRVKDGLVFAATHQAAEEEDGSDNSKLLVALPQALQDPVLYAGHEAAGHFGASKTKALISQQFYWPKMGRQIKDYCRTCPVCLQWNNHKEPKPPLQPLPVVSTPWSKVALDIVGPLPLTKDGYRYLLTIIDFGTRFVEAIPLKRVDAKTTCQALMQVFACFGVPEEILTDNGGNFTAAVTEELLKHLQCSHITSSPYHPQSNGMVERANGIIKKVLDKIAAGKSKTRWKELLPAMLMAVRTAKHTALGVSPYHLLFGREARTPVAALRQTMTDSQPLDSDILTYLDTLYKELADMEELVQERDTKAKANSKAWYDKGAVEDPLQVGDQVLCMLPTGDSGLTAKWEGPYTVTEVLGPLTYLIDKPTNGRRGRRVHRNALKRFVCHVSLAHVITAEEDSKQLDGYSLGPEIPDKAQQHSQEDWEKAAQVPGLLPDQQKDLLQLIQRHKQVFSDLPGDAKLPAFTIETGQATPTAARPYSTPLNYWDQTKKELQNMEDLGIIEDSTSPWSSPVICVPKPGGGLRLCMDYRRLNGVTTTDVYPLPNIEHLVQKIAGSKFITTMDLTRGYYQIPLNPDSKSKTAFVTAFGKWQFRRMPFGVKNAPAWFQRHMDQLLKRHDNADAYIDDVCVYSDTWEEHLSHLEKTLEILSEAGLTVKLCKCSFARSQVQYLGHYIGGGKIAPVDAKIQAIAAMDRPSTKKGLRRFLGMASYYRRFIPGFADKAAQLHSATSKKEGNTIRWTAARQDSFKALQAAMTQTVTLHSPDQMLPYTLKTDASGTGIGAALEQQKEGETFPVAFYSRKLTPVESRYAATELEALAIIEAIRHFEIYLKGACFIIETDHKALEFIQTMKRGSPKLMRWAALLQEHNCTLTYRPGTTNAVADALSRMFEEDACQRVLEDQPLLHLPAKPPEVGGDVGPLSASHHDGPCLGWKSPI